MADINLLDNVGQLFNDTGSSIELSKGELNALSDDNVMEDMLILSFDEVDVLKVKADLGSRYNLEKIEYYNSGNVNKGVSIGFSENDVLYTPLTGETQGDHVSFDAAVKAQYIKVSHVIDPLIRNHSPEVITVTSGTIDSDGSTLLNSSVINGVYYYNRPGFFGPGKGWFNEPFVAGVRGKRREFPNHSLFVSTSNSLEVIDLENMNLWMRFLTGATMLGSSEPQSVFVINDRAFVVKKNGGLRVIDFDSNVVEALDTTGNYLGDIGIETRNSSVVFSLKTLSTVYPTNILSDDINDISGASLFGVEYVGLATASGVSLLVDTGFVTNSTDGTLPGTSVDVSSNGSLYWSGNLGISGEVNFVIDVQSVVVSGTTTTASFSRDGFYSATTTPKLISNFINKISVL